MVATRGCRPQALVSALTASTPTRLQKATPEETTLSPRDRDSWKLNHAATTTKLLMGD
jgi:hypothetical protein